MPQQKNAPFSRKDMQIPATGLKILVVDDDNSSRLILSSSLAKFGHIPVTARDGREAVELFEQNLPDIVIMDIMMPVMDGYEATRLIKKRTGDSFVPVIALTSLEDEEGLAKCIAAGADDFLSKPVTPTILNAKIDSMMRIRALYDTVNRQKGVLAELIDEKDREMAFAEKIYSRIVYKGSVDEPNIHYWTSPMAIFSGDFLLMARGPFGAINVIMGDFTGHGLSAAMGSIPASEIFYTMTAKGYCVNDIAMELNRKLRNLLPAGIFLAAGLVQLDSRNGTATVWNGALPDIYVLRKEGGIKKRLKSRNLPLGVVDNSTLDSTVEITAMAEGDCLCLFSDGVTEARRADGQMFGEDRLEECLKRNRGNHLLEEVRAAVDDFCGGKSQSDDITMAGILCGRSDSPLPAQLVESTGGIPKISRFLEWGMLIELEANGLQEMDPLPMIMQFLMQDDALFRHKENLFLIISEFFTNALDHGLLGMDGTLKKTMEGMLQYYSEREKALADLESGAIRMEIKNRIREGKRVLAIRVEDSGPGFDHTALCLSPLSDTCSMGGRGIQLVRTLCSDVVYHGNGNTVEATYIIG